MLQKIRTLFAQEEYDKFYGSIELDEVYIGGKEKWKHMSKRTPNTQGRSTKTKTPIFGIMEYATYIDKNGVECKTTYAHAFVVEATDGKTLLPIVAKYVERGSYITTDELNSYTGLGDMGYYHRVVRHGSQEYVRDGVNTNAMEGFWSHFRRMIMGCYHDVRISTYSVILTRLYIVGIHEIWTNLNGLPICSISLLENVTICRLK